MVSVCNNLAFGKVDEKSDIDLFIVAEKDRLFIVRTLVTFFLHLIGMRRHGRKVAGRFCLSFFVDDSYLDLSKIAIENDIYLAYWIKTMVPVIDDGLYIRFLNHNKWVDDYFDGHNVKAVPQRLIMLNVHDVTRRVLNFLLDGLIGDVVEWLLRKWQIKRASEKAKKVLNGASLVIGPNILKFHNIDRRKEYRDKWFAKYNNFEKLTKDRFLSL